MADSPIEHNEVRYLSVKATATLIRQRLRREYPETRFSVRSRTYAGGASIGVSWVDGPAASRVNGILAEYEGSGFDPTTDLKYPQTHYLRPDGSAYVQRTEGEPGTDRIIPGEGHQAVRFQSDFVHCSRRLSRQEELATQATEFIYAHCPIDNPTGNPHQDRFGIDLVSTWVNRLLTRWEAGKDWDEIIEELR